MLKRRLKRRLKSRLSKSRKNLLISAAVVALCGSAAVFAAPAEQGRTSVAEQVQLRVNINSASASEIAASLKGVGMKTARAIVAYRDANGAFKSLDALSMVKGVGRKTIKRNKENIALK